MSKKSQLDFFASISLLHVQKKAEVPPNNSAGLFVGETASRSTSSLITLWPKEHALRSCLEAQLDSIMMIRRFWSIIECVMIFFKRRSMVKKLHRLIWGNKDEFWANRLEHQKYGVGKNDFLLHLQFRKHPMPGDSWLICKLKDLKKRLRNFADSKSKLLKGKTESSGQIRERLLEDCIDLKWIDQDTNGNLKVGTKGGEIIEWHYPIRLFFRNTYVEHIIKYFIIPVVLPLAFFWDKIKQVLGIIFE